MGAVAKGCKFMPEDAAAKKACGPVLAGVAVALVPLGCPKNDADGEYLLGLLCRAGARVVADPAEADAILVNTCAFIQPAVEEAIDTLLELAEVAAESGGALVCTGCLPARYGHELLAELPEVRAFVGPGALEHVVEAVDQALHGERLFLAPRLTFIGSAEIPRCRIEPPWRATVKISDGCCHACSFCTIPSIRGRYRSRTPDDIAEEVRRLVRTGVVEVNLVAQDTAAYGDDLGEGEGLARLLEQLAPILGADRWLRVQYLHPERLSPAATEAILNLDPVVPYFDLPLQHAAPSVLRLMGRQARPEAALDLVAAIRSRCPEAAVRATFIVGFPGETEDDFRALLDFVETLCPDHTAAFIYCPEEGTRAAGLPQTVPQPVARERHQELLEVARCCAQARSEELVGKTLRVLVEGTDEETGGDYVGRTFRDAPGVDGHFYLESMGGPLQPGSFTEALVKSCEANDLRGRMV